MFSFSQVKTETKSNGKAVINVFANFHTDFKDVVEPQIARAYLGYNYKIDDKYSIKVIYDVADPGDWGKLKHTGYLKNAELKYKHNKIQWTVGMISTTQFKVQESFWSYRYLAKSFQDEYHINASADIGASFAYSILNNLSIDAIVQNGEGYKYVQMDNTLRAGVGVTYDILKSLKLRVFYDNSSKTDIQQQSFAGFIGYKFKDKFAIATEYNKQLDFNLEKGKELGGYSTYITYFINKKFQIFGRFDYLESNKLENETTFWNLDNDGNYYIGGVQMKLAKGVKVSSNYQGFQSANKNLDLSNMLFVNFEYKLK